MQRSIEVEYWVIDEDGRLVHPDALVDAAPEAEREFVEPLLEIKTPPCSTTAALHKELFGRIEAALDQAAELNRRLVPLATPMTDDEIQQLPTERIRIQDRAVGDAFECVRRCAGTHVHVEQIPGREIDQWNVLTALDPALALVNSSPYDGLQPSVPGARSKLYRRTAYEGLENQGRLWSYLDDYDEWERRLETGYEAFRQAALEAGVDEGTFEAEYDPESAVWIPVKLRAEFSTVEWRSADTALPSQILQLADNLTSIVERVRRSDVSFGDSGAVTDDGIVLPPFETLESLVDEAIYKGLGSSAVRSYLTRMGFDVDAYQPITADFDAIEALTPAEARRIRLQYADRLEADVRRGQTAAAE